MKKLTVVPGIQDGEALTQAVLSYREIKAKITFLENELKAHKNVIEDAASKTKDGVIITSEYKITLSIAERESFSLKQAKAVLGEEVLKDFISRTPYTTLRVS